MTEIIHAFIIACGYGFVLFGLACIVGFWSDP